MMRNEMYDVIMTKHILFHIEGRYDLKIKKGRIDILPFLCTVYSY